MTTYYKHVQYEAYDVYVRHDEFTCHLNIYLAQDRLLVTYVMSCKH